MNCYDFDKTIIKRNSTVEFYKYCLFKHPRMIWHCIKTLFFLPFFVCGILTRKSYIQKYFAFLQYFKDTDILIDGFTKKLLSKKPIANFYRDKMRPDDVVCSASPEFLVSALMKKINKDAVVIATVMNQNTGAVSGEICKGQEKVQRLFNAGYTEFEYAYSDSLSDLPMLDLAKYRIIVKKEKLSTIVRNQ